MTAQDGTHRGLARLLRVVEWLPRYERRQLRGDVIAGIAVTALVVPKNLGYAGIAGVPLQNGLYAAAAGAIIYALFCTSRHISTGPSSSLAAVAGGAVLATGVLFLLLAVFRMGWIARFLSKAVVTGFLAGAAVDVVIGELPKLTGTSSEGDSAWREFATWVSSLGDIHGTTVLVGVLSLAVIVGLRFLARRFLARLYWSSAACWHRPCLTSARMVLRWSVTCPAGCPPRGSLTSRW